jgi:hypothetical protein
MRLGIAEASISVNVSPVADAVEQDTIPLDVVANAIVTHPHSPLTNPDIGQLAPLTGILLKHLQHLKDPPMHTGVESPKVATEAIRDDECKAGHTRRVSSPGAPWRGGPGGDPLSWRPFQL